MYTRAYDKDLNLLVGLWSGSSNRDEDFERSAEDLARLDRDGARCSAGIVHVVAIDSENRKPNTLQRKRLAEAVARATCAPKAYLCMVTSSPIHRGVLTAVGWFVPSDRKRVTRPFATFEEAAAFLETHRPGVTARLSALRRAAREEALAQAAEPQMGDRSGAGGDG